MIILFKPHSNIYKVDIIISMIQIRELKLRKVKQLSSSSKDQDLNMQI